MKNLLLEKIRLTQYFVVLFITYGFAVILLPSIKFSSGALTLFSVNSFLYGFYIAPILTGQKGRIEELHRTVRAEANAMFGMIIGLKKLPASLRNDIQSMFTDYMKAVIKEHKSGLGESNYEELITYCLQYKGDHQDEVDKLLDKLVANQINRTNFAMQMSNKVFSNEWFIMLVLFSITESFVLLIDSGSGLFYQVLSALLCTGLSMLLLILVKLSTLTHKKAKQIWLPYQKLVDSHFYRID